MKHKNNRFKKIILSIIVIFFSALILNGICLSEDLEKKDEETLSHHYNLGMHHYHKKDYVEAVKEFEEVINLDTDYKDAMRYFIYSYQAMFKEDLEKEIRNKKEEQEKNRKEELEKLIAEGRQEDIDLMAAKEVELKEKLIAHYNLGKTYYQQKDYVEAISEFEKVINLDAGYKDSARYLMHSYQALAKDDLEAEIEKKKEVQEKVSKTAKETEVVAERKEYRIGREDELSISVWGWSDLKVDAIVRPDGKISFPLIGDVQAVGLTLTELDTEITQRLKSYIRVPDVSIMLKKIGGNKVIVLGEVGTPGVYKVSGDSSVLEVIALAGGFKEDAVVSSVIVIKGGFQNPHGMRINLSRAIDRTDMSQNIALEPEDIVYVPKKFIANVNYLMRQIITPVATGAITVKALED